MSQQDGQIHRVRLYPEEMALADARGAVRRGHFVYGDGTHGEVWVDTRALLGRSELVDSYAGDLGVSFFDRFGVVVAPAVKGIPLAFAIAARWGGAAVWLDKKINKQGEPEWSLSDCFARQVRNQAVLLVDDVIQTGLTMTVAKREIERVGGKVIGAAIIWNRSGEPTLFGKIPLRAIIERSFQSFYCPFLDRISFLRQELQECPLCLKRIPVNEDYGKGTRFLRQLVLAAKGDIARELALDKEISA